MISTGPLVFSRGFSFSGSLGSSSGHHGGSALSEREVTVPGPRDVLDPHAHDALADVVAEELERKRRHIGVG
jgi:hypothetical protein